MAERTPIDEGPWWLLTRGAGPVAAAAIHDGHGLRAEVSDAMLLSDDERLREEDPFTGQAIAGVANHIIACRSRFEFDLNREGDEAVYTTPEQSWGLRVWNRPPDRGLIARSHAIHAAFYRMLAVLLDEVVADYDRFVLLDVHSYNHRRNGPAAAPMPQENAPDINIGTSSMPRDFWAPVVEPVLAAMRDFDFNGRRLDVRENIAFQGKGALVRFVHDRYPGRGCAIAIEFKKFYMDEWTGVPDPVELEAMRAFIDLSASTAAMALT